MQNRDLTVHEFAAVNNLDYAQSSALIKVMRDNNLVERVATQRSEGGRGKGRAVYRFTPEALSKITSLLEGTFTNEIPEEAKIPAKTAAKPSIEDETTPANEAEVTDFGSEFEVVGDV